MDVGTQLRLKRNIHVVSKDYLVRLHVFLVRWISHQSCFFVQTIGNSSRRECIGTTVTVLPFLREEICQRKGVSLLSKIDLFLLLFVQDLTCNSPLLQISNCGLVRERFLMPSIPLVLPSAANGEVAIISILHMDVTD